MPGHILPVMTSTAVDDVTRLSVCPEEGFDGTRFQLPQPRWQANKVFMAFQRLKAEYAVYGL